MPDITSTSCLFSLHRLHLRQSIQSLVVPGMITVTQHLKFWIKKCRPFAKCLVKKCWELYQCLQWPSIQWPIFFLPHFLCCRDLFNAAHFSPQLCSWDSSAFTSWSTSLLAACLQTAGRRTPTRFVWAWFGLARSHGDLQCSLWWLRRKPPTPHSSPLSSKDRSGGFSYLLSQICCILLSRFYPPCVLLRSVSSFFFWLFLPSSVRLLIAFPLSLSIRTYDKKKWFSLESAADVSRLSLVFEWKLNAGSSGPRCSAQTQ